VIELLSRLLGVSERQSFNNLHQLGNTSSASLPILLKDAESQGRLRRGDHVLMMGFGAGFSWGGCLARW